MGSNLKQLFAILNKTLTLEYTLIIHYPRLARMIKDVETRKLVNGLGTASIKHANIVANALIKLGGKPSWSFDSFPEQADLVDIFQTQLAKEKAARDLHRQSMYMISDSALRNGFAEIAREEEYHIKTVENILKRLTELEQ